MTDADYLLPDPDQSRVVLVGSSKYESPALPNLPTVGNNLSGLAAVLRDPGVWGIPAENCKVVRDPENIKDVIDPIQIAAAEAADMLIIYYAGHGLTDRKGDLYLTVASSVPGKPYMQVWYEHFREPIADSQARRRIIILDCCYSGRATEGTLGDEASYAAQVAVDGSFVLTATPANQLAQAPADQEYTAFTHEFIAVLREGLIGGAALITLNEIYSNVRIRLSSQSQPQPQARDRNNLGRETCFRNKAFQLNAARRYIGAEERTGESLEALTRVRTACVRASADFLRREKLRTHERLYIQRPLDRDIESVIRALGPANLRHTQRASKALPSQLVDRPAPPQLIVLSDAPGTGKTMLVVQLSRMNELCGTVLRPAASLVADDLRRLLDGLGPGYGMAELITARTPLVYVIDGLDRADHVTDQKNIIELFRFIDQDLNPHARSNGLLAFPVAVLVTIRESDWDKWFTIFEGREVASFRRNISQFTLDQFKVALNNYTSVYEYELIGNIPAGVMEALALPVNLRLLSEAHEYRGQLDAAEVLREHLLTEYVRRKSEEIVSFLPFLTGEQLTAILTTLARGLIAKPGATASIEQLKNMLACANRVPKEDALALLRILIDERILLQDGHGVRFSYPAILEYLLAAASVRQMNESGRIDSLESLTTLVAKSEEVSAAAKLPPVVSAAAIRSNVESIVTAARSEAQRQVRDHYTTSPVYTGSLLAQLRFEIATGATTSDRELESIYGSLNGLVGEDAWNAFYIVAAVNNQQPADQIITVFAVAWDTNEGRPDRWKSLSKLRQRGLLYCDEAVSRVTRSREPREWETFLGWVNQEPDRMRVVEQLLAADGSALDLIGHGPAWDQTKGLLRLLSEGRSFVGGEVF